MIGAGNFLLVLYLAFVSLFQFIRRPSLPYDANVLNVLLNVKPLIA